MADPTWDELADLAELVAAQRAEVARRNPCGVVECRSTSAHEHTLWELGRRLTQLAPKAPGDAHTAFEAARRAADVLSFEVPASHRARGGRAITRAKSTAVAGLKPVLVELLRPQHRFNVEAIEVLKVLWSRRKAATREDSSSLVRKRLGGLTDATAWSTRTHRAGAAARAITSAKRLSLQSLAPIVTPLLTKQREWNEAAVETMSRAAATPALSEAEASGLILELAQLRERVAARELPLAFSPSAPLWDEVFRKQDHFNRELTLAIAELLEVRLPPSAPPEVDYGSWLAGPEERSTGPAAGQTTRVAVLPIGFSPAAAEAESFVESLLAQSHADWVLVSDGASGSRPSKTFQRVVQEQRVVASLEGAGAEFVLLVGPSVVVASGCLASLANAAAGPTTAVAYSDEDLLADGERTQPFFKPDWSPDLELSFNYLGRCFLASTAALGTRLETAAGEPDAELHRAALEATAAAARVVHVPEVLFHRTDRASMAAPTETARRMVEAFLRRRSPNARVKSSRYALRPEYPLETEPLVSIVVPYRDRPELLERLCATLLPRTGYRNFELLLVSNQSVLPETAELRRRLEDPRIRHLDFDEPFNFSRINNFAADHARGSILVFLNNDMEVVGEDWLRELVSHAARPEIGAVGAKLTFPDGGLQHAGVVVGLAGFAGHPFWRFTDEGHLTPWGRPDWPRNLLAVTAACVAMRRDLFTAVGGFDERFAVVGGDIELCLRIHAKGLRNLFTPFAHLVHHESASRRADAVPEGDYWASFQAYRPFLRAGDPFYNPNLTLLRPDASLRGAGEDAQALAVRTLVGTLGTIEERAVRAHAIAQRHVADHLPAFRSPRTPTQVGGGGVRSIRWLANARSESLDTVLRFARACEQYGKVRNEVVIVGGAGGDGRQREDHPFVRFASTEQDLAAGDAPDAVIAADWVTAYAAATHPGTPRRAQFVQSLGELHYAAGTFYGIAQNSYRLGLHGIFHGEGLLRRAREAYQVNGCAVALPVAPHLRPRPESRPAARRRVFVHTDANDGRDAFEIAMAAAAQVAAAHPDAELVTAGTPWSVKDFPRGSMIRHFGKASTADLAQLYASCDAALVLGFGGAPTRAQLELMASAVPLVVNGDAATDWLLQDGRTVICAEPTASCLAEAAGRLLSDEATARELALRGKAAVDAIRWEPQVTILLEALADPATRAG